MEFFILKEFQNKVGSLNKNYNRDFGLDYIRNNPNLRAPGIVDNISASEWFEHMMEFKKITEDICYFAEKYMYIVSLDKGKCIIKLYPKQAEFLRCLVKNKRVITLASRQTGKTTTYTIYALWYVLTHKDKNILICANKLKTATEILSRIKMAYEMLPNWLKPGVKQWNKTMIELSNGCKIGAEATSGDSGRSFSINCLVGSHKITLKNPNGKINCMTLEDAYKKYPCNVADHVKNNFNDIGDLFSE